MRQMSVGRDVKYQVAQEVGTKCLFSWLDICVGEK
jgi:hypothetical protein